jgi:type IV secretory pathway VirB6-like protein
MINFMNLTKKIAHILALIFLVFSVASCEEGCVEPDEFDVNSEVIESNPVNDGVFGYYDGTTGGQRANWHSTSLRANGAPILVQISGSWVALEGPIMSENAMATLPRCNFCAKRYDNSSPNCICYLNQVPTPEKSIAGVPLNVDCTIPDNQNDPLKCSCTKQRGAATDYGTYHFPLNILEKNESIKVPDKQTNCKYDRGMGAYIALWGNRGVSTPLRAYHLFSEEELCNVIRDSQGRCLDDNGKDVTRYIFRSANKRGLLKDDGEGNHTIDFDTSDDVYHRPNELLKTIMYDSYYSDNLGRYNVRILGGFGNEQDPGLLEFLVSLIEEVLLGKINDEGEREGGIIEFMYKSIIKDSGFALTVQVSLSLYIALFGAAHLFGLVEISSRKELMNRVIKIGLIIFFISDNSWYFYNKIVVAFFKDSMDYIVSMIMDLQDAQFDATTMIKISQMERSVDISNATRFSYVDLIIKNLMSDGTTKKIWGLFFNSIFGFLYIPLIYALIFAFIYVMLYVASMYVSNMIKIVFVLSMGPIFMVFTLFSKTSQMFKNWLGFLGGRSLEVIVIFTVLYLFLMMIDKAFTDMLFYRVCAENKGIGFIKLIILVAQVDRSFVEWIFKFIGIGALLFITYMVIEKVPSVSGSIISVGGVGGGSGSGMAGGLMGGAMGLAKMAGGGLATVAGGAARYGIRGATLAARRAGITGAWNKIGKYIPITNPRTMYRHAIIDGAIKKAAAAAGGLTGAKRDEFIRNTATQELQLMMRSQPNKMAAAGVDMHNILARYDKKLVKEPLKKFLKSEAKAIAARGRFGDDARKDLKKSAMDWANKNLNEGDERVGKYLKESSSLNKLIDDRIELSSSRAAKSFAGDDDTKNRYLQHLMKKDEENYKKRQEADKHWYSKAGNALGRAYDSVRRDKHNNPRQMEKSFLRKAWQKEQDKSWYQRSRFSNSDAVKADRWGAQKALLADGLMSGSMDGAFARDRLRGIAGKGELGSLSISDLDRANGKDLFELTARMAHANVKDNEKLNLKDEHEAIMKDYMSGRNAALGGMSMGDAVAERERLAALGRMGGFGSADADQSLLGVAGAQAQGIGATVDQYGNITDANLADAQKSSGLVAQQFEVQFGQSITDALLQQSDLGLKASNVALGVAPEKAGELDLATINALKVNQHQVLTKLKIDNMNKRISEFKLKKLQDKQAGGVALTDAESREVKDLEGEIRDLDSNIKSYSNESDRLEADIKSNGG